MQSSRRVFHQAVAIAAHAILAFWCLTVALKTFSKYSGSSSCGNGTYF